MVHHLFFLLTSLIIRIHGGAKSIDIIAGTDFFAKPDCRNQASKKIITQ